jgi:hypothetical protein
MEVVYPVLEFRKKKQTFTKVEGGSVNFFPKKLHTDCPYQILCGLCYCGVGMHAKSHVPWPTCHAHYPHNASCGWSAHLAEPCDPDASSSRHMALIGSRFHIARRLVRRSILNFAHAAVLPPLALLCLSIAGSNSYS